MFYFPYTVAQQFAKMNYFLFIKQSSESLSILWSHLVFCNNVYKARSLRLSFVTQQLLTVIPLTLFTAKREGKKEKRVMLQKNHKV